MPIRTDTCTGTPLVFTLTDGLTVGLFGDSFGINTATNSYTDNGWTDGDGAGQDCRVESVAGVGVIDSDRYLRLRNGCTQTKSSISTSGLTNIHLKYRWGQDTTVASPGSLTVEWKKSSDVGWTNVNTHPLANSGGAATIPELGGRDASAICQQHEHRHPLHRAVAALDPGLTACARRRRARHLRTGPKTATMTVHKDFSDNNTDRFRSTWATAPVGHPIPMLAVGD